MLEGAARLREVPESSPGFGHQYFLREQEVAQDEEQPPSVTATVVLVGADTIAPRACVGSELGVRRANTAALMPMATTPMLTMAILVMVGFMGEKLLMKTGWLKRSNYQAR
jgi:hypothetical protein